MPDRYADEMAAPRHLHLHVKRTTVTMTDIRAAEVQNSAKTSIHRTQGEPMSSLVIYGHITGTFVVLNSSLPLISLPPSCL